MDFGPLFWLFLIVYVKMKELVNLFLQSTHVHMHTEGHILMEWFDSWLFPLYMGRL